MPHPLDSPQKRDGRRRPPDQDEFSAESPSANLILNLQQPFVSANGNCPHPPLSHFVTHPSW